MKAYACAVIGRKIEKQDVLVSNVLNTCLEHITYMANVQLKCFSGRLNSQFYINCSLTIPKY